MGCWAEIRAVLLRHHQLGENYWSDPGWALGPTSHGIPWRWDGSPVPPGFFFRPDKMLEQQIVTVNRMWSPAWQKRFHSLSFWSLFWDFIPSIFVPFPLFSPAFRAKGMFLSKRTSLVLIQSKVICLGPLWNDFLKVYYGPMDCDIWNPSYRACIPS